MFANFMSSSIVKYGNASKFYLCKRIECTTIMLTPVEAKI